MKPLFRMGMLVFTDGIAERAFNDAAFIEFIDQSVNKHRVGNWGDVSPSDWDSNNEAVKSNDRIVSAYQYGDERIWIITEWDRSVTTILFPDEY